MRTRRHFKHTTSLEERLTEDTDRLREQIKTLPPGAERDQAQRRIRQNETAAHISEWLNSPGLKAPIPG